MPRLWVLIVLALLCCAGAYLLGFVDSGWGVRLGARTYQWFSGR